MKKGELDDKYHIALLNPKTGELLGEEEQFETLEEVLGWLHKVEESKNIESMFACVIGLRDGESKVAIHRERFQAGEQILRIRPPERFHKLFWTGFGLVYET